MSTVRLPLSQERPAESNHAIFPLATTTSPVSGCFLLLQSAHSEVTPSLRTRALKFIWTVRTEGQGMLLKRNKTLLQRTRAHLRKNLILPAKSLVHTTRRLLGPSLASNSLPSKPYHSELNCNSSEPHPSPNPATCGHGCLIFSQEKQGQKLVRGYSRPEAEPGTHRKLGPAGIEAQERASAVLTLRTLRFWTLSL